MTPFSYLNAPTGKDNLRFGAVAQAWGTLGNHWAAHSTFVVDTDGSAEPHYHNRKEWKGLSGDFRRAALTYCCGGFGAWVGRNEIWWGPGQYGSLSLSDAAPSLDAIGLRLRYKMFEFSAFHAFLQRDNPQADSLKINRYLSGHRLDIHFHRNLILGFSELVMYGGPGESVTASYFNPFVSYYVIDVLNYQERNDNVLVAAELSYFWKNRSALYAQYLIDEFIYEGEDYPNATALLLGIDVLYPFGIDGLTVAGEFARLQRWVYYYQPENYWNRYLYLNRPLGHWLGSDGYVINFDINLYVGSYLTLDICSFYSRKGESDPATTIRPKGRYQDNFLSGIIESTFEGELGLVYSPSPERYAQLAVVYRSIENERHLLGRSNSSWELRARIGYRLRMKY